MLGTGASLWLEPVRTTIALGQISIVLLAIVVLDLLPLSRPSRWQGVGVGIAAGIKLTPMFFIPFLLVTRSVPRAFQTAPPPILALLPLSALLSTVSVPKFLMAPP